MQHAYGTQDLYICEDSQPKLFPAAITEDNESMAISINKINDIIIIKVRKNNSYSKFGYKSIFALYLCSYLCS